MTRGRAISAALLLIAFTSAGVGFAETLSYRDGDQAWARKEYAEAIRIWRTMGERGDLQSQMRLAETYYTGQGIGADYREAMTWARKASDQSGDGMVVQGWLYAEGKGVPKDAKKALSSTAKARPRAARGLRNISPRPTIAGRVPRKTTSRPGFGWTVPRSCPRDGARGSATGSCATNCARPRSSARCTGNPRRGEWGTTLVATNKYLPSEAPDANCKLHISAVKIDGKLPPGITARNGGLTFEGTPRQPGEWNVRATLTGLTCIGQYDSYGDRVVDVTFKITP